MDGLYIGIGAFVLFIIIVTAIAVDVWQCCMGRPTWWRK